jgi:Family of unknown function (DUF6491)
MNAVSIDRRYVLMRAAMLLAILTSLLGAMQRAAAGVSTCEARAAVMHQVLPAESLDNWEPVSDRAVLIWTQHSARAYLVSLDRRLRGLTTAPIIDLVDGDHDRRISACGHDGITIGDGAGKRTIARIVSIELLSARRTAELDPGTQSMRTHSGCERLRSEWRARS